jgi:RHS repeat-associated protein
MFSPNPTLQDIFLTPLFEEPLVPIGADPTPAETAALAAALEGYAKRSGPDDFSSLTGFLEAYPESPWNAALLTDLGLEYYSTGHYSKTLEVWSQAWQLAGAATDLKGKAVADRAVGELAYMYARLGRMMELDTLLKSIEGRVFSGPATERITGAREGLWNMRTYPEIAFRCGPLALHRIKLSVDPENPGTELIRASASTQEGFSLQHVTDLSQKLGLNFRMAFREKNAGFVVPSVVHLKVDHYAALIRQEGDRYLLQDPTFRNDVWVTSETLEAETTGYYLIPPGELARGWRAVGAQEGERVWGKGITTGNDPDPFGRCDPKSPGGSRCPKKPNEDNDCKGMAVPRVHLMLVSLNINDEPVGYSPPIGPAVRFTVRYNQRDGYSPGNRKYSNLGAKWTFEWLSYITDEPSNPAANVTYYMMGGGTRTFTGFDSPTKSYAFEQYDQTKLTRPSPNRYEMLSRDGTRKVFSQSDGSTSAKRKVFLTQLIDPFGNAVSLTYDGNRLVKITDAIGQVTTISYEHPTDPTDFKIAKVTDPFGRSASFDYDASNRLSKITDVTGITSEFTYDGGAFGDFITTLTTPYGVTSFAKSESGTTRSLETVYPDGNKDRVEYTQSTNLVISDLDPLQFGSVRPQSVPGGMATRNEYLYYRNTYYWDKMACAYAYGDHTKAKVYHWLHTTNPDVTAGILESVKEPLEGRVWYDYAGQSSNPDGPLYVGSSNKPTHVGRVLDDGSTQLYTYEYNGFGNVTKMIDPVGLTFSYIYAENGIDLLEVRQTRAGQNQLLSTTTYKAQPQHLPAQPQHLPETYKDAAGQTTTYTYNSRGQILTETNAKNETTTYDYDGSPYLKSVHGPQPGPSSTFTYDSFGRVRTKTDESGYALTFDYDALDRLKKVTFPDDTFDEFTYTRLDHTLTRDRAGRQTAFDYNSVRQMTKRTDSLNRVTLFQWCKCGDLTSLTDPLGRTTTWQHDIQGRVKGKEYADGSKSTYRYEDTVSRLRQRIDEKLQVTQYQYNRDDTVSRINYTNAAVATPPVAFTYDANYSRLSSMTDGIGTTRYSYIPISPLPSLGAGQLASVDGPLPNSNITFDYDSLGRRISTAIDGLASSVTFDAAGRIETTSNALGVFRNHYDGSSLRVDTQAYPHGQTAEFKYRSNLEDQLLQRITNKLGSTPISEFIYSHDVPQGQISSWSQQIGTQTPSIYSLIHDPVGQLKAASVSVAGSLVSNFSYSYDQASNRETEQIGTTTRQFYNNALNELTAIESDAGPSPTYQWDAEQRLSSVNSGNQSTQFTYDGLGRRVGIRQLVDGAEVSDRRFIWCDNQLCEERTPSGAVSKRFFAQGMKLEMGSTTGTYYYTRDHLGSIRELTDINGNIRARYSYDPFGRRTRLSGDVETDFGFAGMMWSTEVSLNLTKFRAYDPELGRWLSRDSLANAEPLLGPNLYTYVNNDPVNLTDPSGQQWENYRRWVEIVRLIIDLTTDTPPLFDVPENPPVPVEPAPKPPVPTTGPRGPIPPKPPIYPPRRPPIPPSTPTGGDPCFILLFIGDLKCIVPGSCPSTGA